MSASVKSLLVSVFSFILNYCNIFHNLKQTDIVQKFRTRLPIKWNFYIREAFKKKLLRRRHWSIWEGGGKKIPFFLVHQKGDIFLWREGSKFFCHMSHAHFLFLFHTICSLSWGLTLWKFSISCNKVVDLNLKCHRVFANSHLEKWDYSQRGGGGLVNNS